LLCYTAGHVHTGSDSFGFPVTHSWLPVPVGLPGYTAGYTVRTVLLPGFWTGHTVLRITFVTVDYLPTRFVVGFTHHERFRYPSAHGPTPPTFGSTTGSLIGLHTGLRLPDRQLVLVAVYVVAHTHDYRRWFWLNVEFRYSSTFITRSDSVLPGVVATFLDSTLF